MRVEIENLTLKLLGGGNEESAQFTEDQDDLKNMSETRLYPPGTPTELTFKIELAESVIGELRLKNIRWFNRKAELSIILDKKHQNKGHGRKIISFIIDFAFNRLNLHRLEAEVIEFNKAAQRIVEAAGFKLEGILREAKYADGKYWNILRYGLLRSEYNLREK